MTLDPRTPVIIGVGQLDIPDTEADPALEPADLAAEAVRLAAADTGASSTLLAQLDGIRVVSILSCRYPDPGAAVATRVGAESASTAVSPMGGNSPQMLVNRSSLDIAEGRADLIAICGAEAWRTRQQFRRRGENLPWAANESATPAEVIGSEMEMSHPSELARGIAMPVHAYPIFETAVRAAAGRSPDEHLRHIGELWARFSEVATTNPHAAVREQFTAERITTPTPDNRWVGYPYTKWLCSNDRVDQGAAVILASVERAEALGVPRERWVFPWSGTDTAEPTMSLRWDLGASPAIRIGGGRALELAGVGVDDLAHIDLYSCFPSAVQIGADELGIRLDRQLTVTGGLTFAGGPWNNYVTHSIATMVDLLRHDEGAIGLCTANGGLISKHSFGLYSSTPPAEGFRHESPQVEVDLAPHRDLATDHAGPVTVEAYTVMHDREGPSMAMAACLTSDGHRTWATSDDSEVMARMLTTEVCGAAASTDGGGQLRLD